MQLRGAALLLVVSAVLFGTFFANVVTGASGNPPFLNDISELLLLFASCAVFVAATLQLEKKKRAEQEASTGREG